MNRSRVWLCGILAVALVIRLGTAVVVQRMANDRHQLCLIKGDAEGYWELAQRIRDGRDYELYQPPRRVHRMLGFPALLAVSMSLFGESNFAARLLLAVVGTCGCAAVYWLGRELCDESVGLLACAFTVVSPAMAGFSVLLLSETLFAVFLTLSAVCAAKWLKPPANGVTGTDQGAPNQRRRSAWSLATGIAIALATHVRPSALLAGPLLAGLAVWLGRDRWRSAIDATVMLVGLFAALLPWAWRNQQVCGRWVFTTLWSGPSLYDGMHPNATGVSDMRFFDRDRLMERMSEWDVNDHYKRAAWDFAKANPGRAVQLTAIKLWRYWKPWPSADEFKGIGLALATAAFFVPVLSLAIVGAWHERHNAGLLILTIGPLLYFAAIHAVFVGSLRYRLPAEYPLCVMAAVGARAIWDRRRRG